MIQEKEYEKILKGNFLNKPVFRHLFTKYGASTTIVPAESLSESEKIQQLELHTISVETTEVSVNNASQSLKAENETVVVVNKEITKDETQKISIEPLIAQEHLKNDEIHDPSRTSNNNDNKEVKVEGKKGVNALKMKYELILKRHYIKNNNTTRDHSVIPIQSCNNEFEKEINHENKNKSVIEDLTLKKDACDSIEKLKKIEMASIKVEESKKDKNLIQLEKKIENLHKKTKRNCDNLDKDRKVVNCINSKIEIKECVQEEDKTIVVHANDLNNDVNFDETKKVTESKNNQSVSLIIQAPEKEQTPTFKSLFDFWEKIAKSSN